MVRITTLTFKKKRIESFEIWLNGERWKEIAAEVVLTFSLKEGSTLTPEERDRIVREDEFVRGRTVTARMLQIRQRSELEVRRRLREKNISGVGIQRIIAYFKEKELIDDEHFARLYIRNQVKTARKTPAQITAALMKKGIDSEKVNVLVDRLFNENAQLTLSLKRARKKTRSLLKKRAHNEILLSVRNDLVIHRFNEQTVTKTLSQVEKEMTDLEKEIQ